MLIRIGSALIGIPVFIMFLYLGNIYLAGFIFALIILGSFEFKRLIGNSCNTLDISSVLIGELIFILGILYNWQNWLSLGIGVTFLSSLLIMLKNYPKVKINVISLNLLNLLYVGWTLVHILLIRNLHQGFLLLLLLFIIIWATDTGAYFTGRFLGKNKLAPQISPKKTIEGAIGGLISSVICAIIFVSFYKIIPVPFVILIAIIISTMGQIGDLIESSFKRFVGIKDSGNIIPGHGGILDRFDSTITTAPILYYILILLHNWGGYFG
ncbi:phosphatidate cytidylyltransferase [Desulfonispora thiosulfatigenes DSM 11270]|uniref:Phosphatidate cytidylyltransferase n=1 Tax=Desulfonispora thiosulfatigenes DSM 11270 TaxID=656914 RepID=A0A1W1VM36_DESTI|nr:phosphatidate cytidylyltransferase [Desulfonispora thiosulfatigenes]SMB94014.1 phosphatidate cytidylyltransferase [Desulfonispora thiosulfatigenes DSM 11270]